MYKKMTFYTIIFLIIDQISKILVSCFMTVNQSINIIPNFFNIEYVHNIGAAFSIMPNQRWLFILIGFIMIFLLFKYLIVNLNKYEIVIYSLLISGILGNMIDRIIYGYVIDFLSFTIFNYNFAIFNLADSFIVISVILLMIGGKIWKNI